MWIGPSLIHKKANILPAAYTITHIPSVRRKGTNHRRPHLLHPWRASHDICSLKPGGHPPDLRCTSTYSVICMHPQAHMQTLSDTRANTYTTNERPPVPTNMHTSTITEGYYWHLQQYTPRKHTKKREIYKVIHSYLTYIHRDHMDSNLCSNAQNMHVKQSPQKSHLVITTRRGLTSSAKTDHPLRLN